MRARALQLLIALDVFLFALICLGNVKRGETASAAAWSTELDGKWQGRVSRPLIDWLFTWLEREHCRASWVTEQGNTQ